MPVDPKIVAISNRISNKDLPPMTIEEAKEWAHTTKEWFYNSRAHDPDNQLRLSLQRRQKGFEADNNEIGLQNLELVKTFLKPSDTLASFMKESDDLIQNLNETDRNLLKLYTTSPGYIVLNTILRGSAVTPTEDNATFMKELRELQKTRLMDKNKAESVGLARFYVNKFLELWNRIPPIQNELEVYRGVQRGEDILLHDTQFISTSTERGVSRGFTKDGCCLLYITIKPGVRALYIGNVSTVGAESEVLIGPPFRAEIVKEGEDLRGFKMKHVVISPVTPRRKSAGTRRRKNGRRSLKRKTKH